MPELIKMWGTALCAGALFAGIVNVLLPRNSVGRAARCVVGLYLALTVVSPFLGKEFKFDLSETNYASTEAELSLSYEGAVLAQASASLERTLAAELENAGFFADEVSAEINMNGTGGIYFEGVRVYLGAEYAPMEREIIDVAKELTGVAPELIYGES